MNILKSVLHNIGVAAVGFVIGAIGLLLDTLFRIGGFYSQQAVIAGIGLLLIGFLIRVWATYYFYAQKMKVIVLEPQHALITDGPYRFSRNPLYLGGNVFIFLGAAFCLGSVSAIAVTLIGIVITDVMIRREERQLEQRFGDEWRQYKARVRRWI